MLKIYDDINLETNQITYLSAEAAVRKIVENQELSLDRKIDDLEEALLAIKKVVRELGEWKEQILLADEYGTLEEYQEELREYFDTEGSSIDFDVFVYGLTEDPLHTVLIEVPLEIEKMHDEAQYFLDTLLSARRLISEKELSDILQGPTTLSKPQAPQEKFSTIQWLGKTEDFHRLVEHLERVLWLAPQSHAGLSQFFFDIDGNPMSSEAPGSAPLKRVQWIGSAIDFYRVSWYLDEKALISEKSVPKFARLFLDSKGKPMKDDSSALKVRDGKGTEKLEGKDAEKLDVKVKDFIDRLVENLRQ